MSPRARGAPHRGALRVIAAAQQRLRLSPDERLQVAYTKIGTPLSNPSPRTFDAKVARESNPGPNPSPHCQKWYRFTVKHALAPSKEALRGTPTNGYSSMSCPRRNPTRAALSYSENAFMDCRDVELSQRTPPLRMAAWPCNAVCIAGLCMCITRSDAFVCLLCSGHALAGYGNCRGGRAAW